MAIRGNTISIDLRKKSIRKGLFDLAAATGDTPSTIVRKLIYVEVQEAAEKGIISLDDD